VRESKETSTISEKQFSVTEDLKKWLNFLQPVTVSQLFFAEVIEPISCPCLINGELLSTNSLLQIAYYLLLSRIFYFAMAGSSLRSNCQLRITY